MKNRYAMTDTQSELCALAEKYADAYDKLNKRFTDVPPEEIVYGRGGVCFHRGPFFPGVLDLFIGNASRGRIVANPRKPESCDWRFYLSDGQLVASERYEDGRVSEREFILREEKREIGLSFTLPEHFPPELFFVSLCQYDDAGKLVSYSALLARVTVFWEEWYEYRGDGLIDRAYYRETIATHGTGSQSSHRLLHDENGIVTAYESENGHVYEVQRGKQRRI